FGSEGSLVFTSLGSGNSSKICLRLGNRGTPGSLQTGWRVAAISFDENFFVMSPLQHRPAPEIPALPRTPAASGAHTLLLAAQSVNTMRITAFSFVAHEVNI